MLQPAAPYFTLPRLIAFCTPLPLEITLSFDNVAEICLSPVITAIKRAVAISLFFIPAFNKSITDRKHSEINVLSCRAAIHNPAKKHARLHRIWYHDYLATRQWLPAKNIPVFLRQQGIKASSQSNVEKRLNQKQKQYLLLRASRKRVRSSMKNL